MKVHRRVLAVTAFSAATGCGADRSPFHLDSALTMTRAAPKHVDFTVTDDAAVPATTYAITPRYPVTPYTQWNANNGYCGELSSVQASMSAGQWMSQFNARILCGAGRAQSGPDGFCAAHGAADYNAQFLLEAANSGDNPFASAPTCLANARLAFETFDYAHQPDGLPGYEQYMTWIKAHVIAGDLVTIGILNRGGSDPQYDHEVTVAKIGTNHPPGDPAYYDDDVLFFEDHGNGGSAYTRGYTFGSLARGRDAANASSNAYSILIPGGDAVLSGTGGDGVHANPRAINPADYAFAVSGPRDPGRETLPVALTLTGSSVDGTAHAPRSGVGFNFEAPGIGDEAGSYCTNVPPTWMTVSLQAAVSGLTPGVAYNLYEYDFDSVQGFGAAAALKVPDMDFNKNAAMATKKTAFTADAVTLTKVITAKSSQVVVVRVVPADGP